MRSALERIASAALLTIAATLTTGCVGSLYPVYSPADVAFDPALLGTWADSESGERAVITRHEKDGYVIVLTEENGKSGRFIAHLARVNGRLTLDLIPDKGAIVAYSTYTDLLLPLHAFVFLDTIGPRLRITTLSPDSLGEHLKRNPSAVAHLGNDADRQFLTAPTRELQTFLGSYLRRPKVLTDPAVWIRQAP